MRFDYVPITWKHDVIHKTGRTYRIAVSLEERRATATQHVQKMSCSFEICDRTDIQTYHIYKHADCNTSHPSRDELINNVDNVRQCQQFSSTIVNCLQLFQLAIQTLNSSHYFVQVGCKTWCAIVLKPVYLFSLILDQELFKIYVFFYFRFLCLTR